MGQIIAGQSNVVIGIRGAVILYLAPCRKAKAIAPKRQTKRRSHAKAQRRLPQRFLYNPLSTNCSGLGGIHDFLARQVTRHHSRHG